MRRRLSADVSNVLRIVTTEAKAGMRLAIPVFHPTVPGQVLLRAGYELEPRSIKRLRDLGVRTLWVAIPELAFLSAHTSPEIIRRQAAVVGHISKLFDGFRQSIDAELEYSAYAGAVTGLIEAFEADPTAAVMVDRIARASDEELEHASTVCYLSTLMGLKLAWYLEHQRPRVSVARAREVVPLGIAGMLHDIGVVRMTDAQRRSVRENQDPLNEDFRAHVEIGYSAIKGRVPPTVAAAVLNHHQRYDGTGFPQRTKADGRVEPVAGEQIHIHPRIIAAADSFDRLSMTGDTEQPRVRVLRAMLRGERASWFDPTVVHALLAVCPPYAPGARVTLSNRMHGVVVGWDARNPCKPRVRRLDPNDPCSVPEGPTIDLAETTGICVAEIDGHDVGRDNFYPEHDNEFCLDSQARRLHNAAEESRARAAG
ncbi:MAG: HD domain-containing phosphohydrolase [Planctomycetota bacterium]